MPSRVQQVISHYNGQIFESSVEMPNDTERSKDPYDPAAFKCSVFLFKDHMSHLRDYL